ncbi:succinate dehydrogenase assembly factor 2 [Candidatus Pelagibacter sp.]|nr:succinate dehydrogenase assembly factor 2 [Candidatus Pelagibacter sp.]
MFNNKEELKNKIIYRASYRGSKEMDILMTNFVNSIINDLNLEQLNELNEFVSMDDETLISIKKKELLINFENNSIFNLIENFQNFKM